MYVIIEAKYLYSAEYKLNSMNTQQQKYLSWPSVQNYMDRIILLTTNSFSYNFEHNPRFFYR